MEMKFIMLTRDRTYVRVTISIPLDFHRVQLIKPKLRKNQKPINILLSKHCVLVLMMGFDFIKAEKRVFAINV